MFPQQDPIPDPSRRRFLRHGAAVAGATLAGPLLMSGAGSSRAAGNDVRSLVCIFLYGGNDGWNTVIPVDDTRHAAYRDARGVLALPREALLPLGASGFALHPALSALAPAWSRGEMAVAFGVGPLATPVDKAQLLAGGAAAPALPGNLFSHHDQQILWEGAGPDPFIRSGWGARASEALGTANPVISMSLAARFGVSAARVPLVLPGPGSEFGAFGLRPEDAIYAGAALRRQAIDLLYAPAQAGEAGALGQAFAASQRDAFAVAERLAALTRRAPRPGVRFGDGLDPIDDAFSSLVKPDGAFANRLAAQLYQVAKLIASPQVVRGTRQVYFAQLDGFDTHAAQVLAGDPLQGLHAALLRELGDAVAAFQSALAAIGHAERVITFTQSDFGRTLRPNATAGSDHGWSSTQLVFGAGVRGGLHGRYPGLVAGGADDLDVERSGQPAQGRMIPGSSVEQYAEPLLRWFGLDEAGLDQALPARRIAGPPGGALSLT